MSLDYTKQSDVTAKSAESNKIVNVSCCGLAARRSGACGDVQGMLPCCRHSATLDSARGEKRCKMVKNSGDCRMEVVTLLSLLLDYGRQASETI